MYNKNPSIPKMSLAIAWNKQNKTNKNCITWHQLIKVCTNVGYILLLQLKLINISLGFNQVTFATELVPVTITTND